MALYRMRIPASICVSVTAESHEEAMQKARIIVDEFDEGVSVSLAGPLDARCYLFEKQCADEIGVEDIETDDEEA